NEEDSNAGISAVVNGSGGEVIDEFIHYDGKTKDLELLNEDIKGFELLENYALQFVKLDEVDCDANKTFHSDLEKLGVGLETRNKSGGTSLVETPTMSMSQVDIVKIQKKKEDNDVKNIKERSGLTTLVLSNDGVSNNDFVVCDTLFE
nr:hypothetical protein [Tanacetum cinerariifolium]